MRSAYLRGVLESLKRAARAESLTSFSDVELLHRYRSTQDEAAFVALLSRHGPMILRVCRRVLPGVQDAEDAFQATFLVLVRQAHTIQKQASLASWLHGVASRIALETRKAGTRRRRHEARARAAVRPEVLPEEATWTELRALLDEELNRLPERLRAPLVLCYLEGLTQDEAAHQLRQSKATCRRNLERGRKVLVARLNRRGVTLSAALFAPLLAENSARAVPPELASSVVAAAAQVAAGKEVTTAVSANVIALTLGVARTMSVTKLKIILPLVFALGVLCAGAAVYFSRTRDGNHEGGAKNQAELSAENAAPPLAGTDDQQATRLAVAAHAQAGTIGKLPRFNYRTRIRHGVVDSLRTVDVSLDGFTRGLSAPVLDKDWYGWAQASLSWDERRFVMEQEAKDTGMRLARFWTATDSWDRLDDKDKSWVQIVRGPGPESVGGSWRNFKLFDYGYLRLTPHRFWWGQALRDGQTMSVVPPEKAVWKHLPAEQFGGEPCTVVESAQRAQRLWISQKTGRVRGVLAYQFREFPGGKAFLKSETVQRISGRQFAAPKAYWDWYNAEASDTQLLELGLHYAELYAREFPSKAVLNELVQFDDYREIEPGVWLPFRETRAISRHAAGAAGKYDIARMELVVEEAKTGQDLGDRVARLLPTEGQRMQDTRFSAPVDYIFSAKRTDEEIRGLADVADRERRKAAEVAKKLVEPYEMMIGKPAPTLPQTGWVGGQRPETAGRPYLIHFWATWCGPCKTDLPNLKNLASRGAIVVGMHPPGTPGDEVEKFVRDQKIGYPTFLAAGRKEDEKDPRIAGYPTVMFPYCILVDATGKVAAHGNLFDLIQRIDVDALVDKGDAVKK